MKSFTINAQLIILFSAMLLTSIHFFIKEVDNYIPFISLFLLGFIPTYIIELKKPKFYELTYMLNSIYIASLAYYFIDIPLIEAVYFFIPINALLLSDKRLYVSSIGLSLFSFLVLTKSSLLTQSVFLSMFLVFAILLTLVRTRLTNTVEEKESMLHGIKAFSLAVEAKDINTEGHSKRVAHYAVMLAESLDNDEIDLDELEMTSMMHDIGKIKTPDAILLKEGTLTEHEYEIIKKHPNDGMRLAKSFGFSDAVLNGILHHHEQYDGKGYPAGLRGDEIPLYSRILAIVDSFDAMTSDRSYRPGLSPHISKEKIVRNSGRMYDPGLVSVFERIYPELEKNCLERQMNYEIPKSKLS
ncbi:HD-GYP domain-containing protein [Alkalihalobacillus sp. AL-G]|uniref:HD-GYP domain-containing protein n=1 Tax=Alkalihalobacillus sp. AL-G TaxID=2926399 RepID=UPI00272A5EE5|nr:HD-GYP domain-containing protein [Alkalihalobacillus sp. AL-G]WLD93657.1 HD-GYP domain-containing protein [Alkalihalobacillus sp. AL-G]